MATQLQKVISADEAGERIRTVDQWIARTALMDSVRQNGHEGLKLGPVRDYLSAGDGKHAVVTTHFNSDCYWVIDEPAFLAATDDSIAVLSGPFSSDETALSSLR